MRAVIQRVTQASVKVDGDITGAIQSGLLVLVGIEDADTNEDMEWLASKIVNMRIFNDEAGVMNVSVKDVDGQILLVSQFTLHASTKKGTGLPISKLPNRTLPCRCMRHLKSYLLKPLANP